MRLWGEAGLSVRFRPIFLSDNYPGHPLMTSKLNRYDRTLAKLPDTIAWSHTLDIVKIKEYLLESDGLPRIFLGSGGSYSAAQLAMQLSVERGIVAAAMTPYQYIFSAWSKLPAKVLIISAGGRNVDAINAYRTARLNPSQRPGVMLMSSPSLLENLMKEDDEPNRFVYNLENGDGFLATNSLVAFYSLLFRIYRNDMVTEPDWSFTATTDGKLKEFISETYTIQTNGWDDHNAALYEARETDRFYVLYSPDTMPVATDLESRFSEGSVGCLQISDYRNFAHGRFNWFHQRKGQTAIIALVNPESKSVSESILDELPEEIPILPLATTYKGATGTLDLLLKGMYLARYLGQRWGLDIGAPNVAEFGKIIHRKDFMAEKDTCVSPDGISEPELLISDEILELPIANISRVSDNIVRGETLWASRNRKYIDEVKAAGVDVIIDFRTADFTDKFSDVCSTKGIEYHHFPIDKANMTDEALFDIMPELFDLLDNRRCYISCQQGLHRTDIALAIYYMFHRPDRVPDLIGHWKKDGLRCDDIMRRLNSLYKALTPEIIERLGLGIFNEAEFRHRRKLLLDTNRSRMNEP